MSFQFLKVEALILQDEATKGLEEIISLASEWQNVTKQQFY
jgi:hypothetical protein